MESTRKLKTTKYGIEDAVGQQVVMEYRGRKMLGDVVSMDRNETLGCFILTINHFNGEQWPIRPRAMAVDVLVRNSEAA